MQARRKKWLIGLGVLAVAVIAGLGIAGYQLSKRFDPFIRQQAIEYLSKRFDGEVKLDKLRVRIPNISPLRVLWFQGRGAKASVEGEGIALRLHGRQDIPPILAIRKVRFMVDLDTLFQTPKVVPSVTVEGMEIYIPPRGERPKFSSGTAAASEESSAAAKTAVLIQEVTIRDATLTIAPRDARKSPLPFDIHSVRLRTAGPGQPMSYDARLTNAKPPGAIHSKGSFGPWDAEDPASTPLKGEYTFEKADLGVFNGIAGILRSSGQFEGKLSELTVHGEADVPDFRLKRSGNRVPLHTEFDVLVDGTNGNTILQPVRAVLGTTKLTTSGGVIQHQPGLPRAITLDAHIADGDMRDVLRLAMKGSPFMEGRLTLHTKIGIPPLAGKVREKLNLDGRFEVRQGKFLKSTIQSQLDGLSRRAQGKPKSEEIDSVVSQMAGVFKLDNEQLTFKELAFGVPGADIELHGTYDMSADSLGFTGAAMLDAKISQLVTGWKRFLLKPIDPIFSRNGAGTYLPIKVEGTSKKPKFGLNLLHH